MLTFFERSPLDQVLRNDKVHRIQPCIQSPIKISGEWPAVCCNMEPLSPLLCHTDFRANEILLCTLFSFIRNHAIQWILSGQHRNHCIWWESPWRKRKALIHWLCGTFVSNNSNSQPLSFVSNLSCTSACEVITWIQINIPIFSNPILQGWKLVCRETGKTHLFCTNILY